MININNVGPSLSANVHHIGAGCRSSIWASDVQHIQSVCSGVDLHWTASIGVYQYLPTKTCPACMHAYAPSQAHHLWCIVDSLSRIYSTADLDDTYDKSAPVVLSIVRPKYHTQANRSTWTSGGFLALLSESGYFKNHSYAYVQGRTRPTILHAPYQAMISKRSSADGDSYERPRGGSTSMQAFGRHHACKAVCICGSVEFSRSAVCR